MHQQRFMPCLKIFAPAIFLFLSVSYGAQAAPFTNHVGQAGFQPHKAIYEIRLTGTHSGSQVINISGQMSYEWQPTCEAWLSNHRFNLFYEYADSAPMNIDSDFSTFESFDGARMDFTSQRKRDGQLFEEIRGHAAMSDKIRQAVYTIPEDLTFDLSQETLFPVGHTAAVLEAIKEGRKYFTATVFDGSDEEGPVEITSFLEGPGQVAEDISKSEKVNMKLLQGPAWKVRLAFFPLDSESETPDYEMSAVLHENGIISDMEIDYDDFSVRQKLVSVEALPGTCTDKPMENTEKKD